MSISDKKWEIVVNLLTIVPAVLKEVPGAVDLYHKMMTALKDDKISDEEWNSVLAERDALMTSIIAETEPPVTPTE
jgi:hypothetical protein